jgi:hypothetical protein
MNITPEFLTLAVAIIGLVIKASQDKAKQAEEMGRLKQQVVSLETRGRGWDTRFESIETKCEQLIASSARIEAILNQRDRG